MNNQAYKAWIDIFDDDISKIWAQEQTELQRSAMIVLAFQKELERLRKKVNGQILELRQNLQTRDKLKQRVNLMQCSRECENKEDEEELKVELMSPSKNDLTGLESPDLFNDNFNLRLGKLVFPTNEEDSIDATSLESSPTLNKSKKKMKRKRVDHLKYSPVTELNNVKKDIFKVPKSDDDTVITCTPESSNMINKKSTNPINRKIRKREKNTTLTQIFSKSNIIEKQKEQEDYDDQTEMAITDILRSINRDIDEEYESCNESVCSVNAFSKGGFLDDLDDSAVSPKTSKMTTALEPIVIGGKRTELVGFSCHKCKKFYTHDKLVTGAFQNECCKQNYEYNQPEETLSGFWDLTFNSQVNEVRK